MKAHVGYARHGRVRGRRAYFAASMRLICLTPAERVLYIGIAFENKGQLSFLVPGRGVSGVTAPVATKTNDRIAAVPGGDLLGLVSTSGFITIAIPITIT